MELGSNLSARSDAQLLLKTFIDNGGYAPGDRLPAERELIENLGITRSNLRKGLDALEREGTIWRHVGKGTFIATQERDGGFANVERLSQEITPVQMMRARLSLEPALAREAAANASSDAVNKIVDARDRAVLATSWAAYEANDDQFHRCIAEATGNVLLLSLYDHLNQVHRTVAWRQVIRKVSAPPRDHSSFTEHDQILEAINARDPVAAQNCMRNHLNSVSTRLFGDE
ncbi:MAG: FadR/GntR family transcriptional regulator [Granulosicoccus sp.]